MSVSTCSDGSYGNWSHSVESAVYPGFSKSKPSLVSVTNCQYSSKSNEELLSASHCSRKPPMLS